MRSQLRETWSIGVGNSQAEIESIRGWVFGTGSPLPGLLLIEVRDSDGLIGVGETFYLPKACWEAIEGLFARHLIGRKLLELGDFFTTMHSSLYRLVGIGAEYRALSALDVALWDLVAQRAGKPLRSILRDDAQGKVAVYNSCAGPQYTATATAPGEGSADVSDPRDDYGAWKRDAAELAQRLIAEGYPAMKLWPFDDLAKQTQGQAPSADQLRQACTPLREIREAVGSAIDVMIDGHGLWTVDAAVEVAEYCEQFDLRWIEDLVLAHPVSNLCTLRSRSRIPILASEYLATEAEFQQLFDLDAVDIAMVDPTWAGGISNSMVIADLAHQYGLPVSFHDCTGPVTLLAGAAMASAIPNHEIQEVARSFYHHVYPTLAEMDAELSGGQLILGDAAGIGVTLRPDLGQLPGVRELVAESSKQV